MADNTYSVTIGGATYSSYADASTADAYLAASITATGWTSLDADTKAQCLVTATRLLDRQAWADGYTTFDQRKVVGAIVNACCELAALFAAGTTDALDGASQTGPVKSMKAGSVSLEYFASSATFIAASRFPATVQELLGPYLASGAASDVGAPYAGGTCEKSAFDQSFGLWRGL